MNNKENQIEEMAKIILDGELAREKGTLDCTEFDWKTIVKVGIQRLAGAKALYNAGYKQKVNDNEVVLSISEVEEFRKDQAEVKFLKKQIQEQARKETAREILQKVDNIISFGERYEMFRVIEQLAEKFGVEVD